MWVEFVVGSRLASRVLSRFPGFPSSTKSNVLKFDQEGARAKANVTFSLNIAIYLFVYL